MLRLETCVNVAAVLWSLALPLATFAAAQPRAPAAATILALAVYAAGGIVCHQLPERTFRLWSTAMPVCARCTGIYLGAAMTALIVVAKRVGHVRHRAAAGVSPGIVRRVLFVAALPTLVTLMFEWSTGSVPGNWARAVAGLPLGAAVMWVIGSISDVK